jgi:hypothetical protein
MHSFLAVQSISRYFVHIAQHCTTICPLSNTEGFSASSELASTSIPGRHLDLDLVDRTCINMLASRVDIRVVGGQSCDVTAPTC